MEERNKLRGSEEESINHKKRGQSAVENINQTKRGQSEGYWLSFITLKSFVFEGARSANKLPSSIQLLR